MAKRNKRRRVKRRHLERRRMKRKRRMKRSLKRRMKRSLKSMKKRRRRRMKRRLADGQWWSDGAELAVFGVPGPSRCQTAQTPSSEVLPEDAPRMRPVLA